MAGRISSSAAAGSIGRETSTLGARTASSTGRASSGGTAAGSLGDTKERQAAPWALDGVGVSKRSTCVVFGWAGVEAP